MITRIEQDEGGVTVTFEKAPSRRFSLVVGAEGLHSAVRRLAFGPDSACLRAFDLYNSWFTAPADIDLGGWFLMRGRAAQKELLARRFAGAGWEVPRLLDAMRRATDFISTRSQVHLDEWSRGRVVLLGDAGYCPSPLTGLGTSLSLVGAYMWGQQPRLVTRFRPGGQCARLPWRAHGGFSLRSSGQLAAVGRPFNVVTDAAARARTAAFATYSTRGGSMRAYGAKSQSATHSQWLARSVPDSPQNDRPCSRPAPSEDTSQGRRLEAHRR